MPAKVRRMVFQWPVLGRPVTASIAIEGALDNKLAGHIAFLLSLSPGGALPPPPSNHRLSSCQSFMMWYFYTTPPAFLLQTTLTEITSCYGKNVIERKMSLASDGIKILSPAASHQRNNNTENGEKKEMRRENNSTGGVLSRGTSKLSPHP